MNVATRAVLFDVAEERDRQIAKGFTPEHDDRHAPQTLSKQAAIAIGDLHCPGDRFVHPASPRRAQLISGIALAVAEVERIDRNA